MSVEWRRCSCFKREGACPFLARPSQPPPQTPTTTASQTHMRQIAHRPHPSVSSEPTVARFAVIVFAFVEPVVGEGRG